MLLKNAYVLNDDFEFKKEDLRIENGVFAEIGNIKGDGIDADGDYIIPGLIDIHMHGSVFCNCEDDNETSLKKIAEYQASIGTTAFLASYSSTDHDTLIRAVKRAVQAHEKNFGGAHIAGIHMEGPYISKKYCGAMNLDNIRNPDDKEINEVLDIAGDLLKIVSLAPENEGAMEFIDKYKDILDPDGDGYIDARDSIYIAAVVQRQLDSAQLSAVQIAAADVDFTGTVTDADVQYVIQCGLLTHTVDQYS